jgi:hypothetical protein
VLYIDIEEIESLEPSNRPVYLNTLNPKSTPVLRTRMTLGEKNLREVIASVMTLVAFLILRKLNVVVDVLSDAEL